MDSEIDEASIEKKRPVENFERKQTQKEREGGCEE